MGALTIPLSVEFDPARRFFGDPTAPRGAPKGWDFLGSCPVPLRARMRDDIAQIAQCCMDAGHPLKCCLPMGQGGPSPMERLRFIRNREDFPKFLVSSEHGNAFNRAFHADFVETGSFVSLQPRRVDNMFLDAGLIDPKGWIGVYAVAPFVILIDRERLGNRPVPTEWAQLCDPVYRGEVVFSGWRGDDHDRWRSFNLFFLLAMLRLLGVSRYGALLENVSHLMHSAQMPRFAGTAASLGAIYVAPWALADLCPRRDRTTVVWPCEGGLAFPLWLTAQAAHEPRVSPFADYLFSEETGAWLDRNRYPSVVPGKERFLPENARLHFLGWDYLRHRATSNDAKRAAEMFHRSRDITDRRRQCAS